MIGRVLGGHYTITKLLGRGGMGIVYLARETASSREVVVKMIAPILRDDQEAVARFEREARRLKSLEHPNIVRFLDYGTEDDLSYLVMEYVDGEVLLEVLERQRQLTFREFVPIASQILKGVGYAHSRDVLLRDIKPSNIVLCQRHGRRNFVKLLDFGLAKGRDGELPITTTHVLGTVGYMAPEVLKGASFDLRGDVYALGVLFYRMLAGRLPFEGSAQETIFSKTLHEAPPPLETLVHDLAIPPGFYRLIDRCLAKDPAERPDDANALVELLIDVVPSALFRLPRAPRAASQGGWEYSDQYPMYEPPSAILMPQAPSGRFDVPLVELPSSPGVAENPPTSPMLALDCGSAAATMSEASGRSNARLVGIALASLALAVAAGGYAWWARPFATPGESDGVARAALDPSSTSDDVVSRSESPASPTPAAPQARSLEAVSERLREAERAALRGDRAAAVEAYLDVLDMVPDHALAASGLQRIREGEVPTQEPAAAPDLPPPPHAPEDTAARPAPSRKSASSRRSEAAARDAMASADVPGADPAANPSASDPAPTPSSEAGPSGSERPAAEDTSASNPGRLLNSKAPNPRSGALLPMK